ncbi:hypothetical protein TIFTF001_031049 [Ficus carica]|uniref:Receptor-like serine/threonine-protein kinase n=1 Tax=Ficus carica TaxID=3494 RepID=A0AA88DUE5_FICCA|nr:hypothetical protein TIFTF001_031049 [Ficus carica]
MGAFCFVFYVTLTLFLLCGVSFAVDSISLLQSISDGTTSLVSKEGIFELGFFSPANSTNRYLGIWYKNISVLTVVWVANRCKPINDSSGLLTINSTGNLVLWNWNASTVVWSTSLSTKSQKPIVQLLDSGNLVLRDEQDSNPEAYLWQSFDYPCDTQLAGMKVGWDFKKGLNRHLSAWRNPDDPCPADFTYGVELDAQLHTYPEIVVRKGTARFYRTGPWNGLTFSGAPELKLNPVFDFGFVYNDEEVYYMFTLKDEVITISVLNQTTSLRYRLTWVESEKIWNTYSSAPRDNCDYYGACGANAICDISGNPRCQCLDRFKPKSQENWNKSDWSDGCVRNHPLSCDNKDKDRFIKFSGLKLPDATHTWVNKSMNLKECRAKCLSNCSCMAYTNFNISGKGSGCAIWFGDLLDMRQFSNGGQDLFIRVSHSELDQDVEQTEITDAINENKLGEGGFGPVYRGTLDDGQEIAVKRLTLGSEQGVNEFKTEVKLISKLQHRNLVRLNGCCIEGEEKILVYEYMPNRSLDYFIFDENQRKLLEWRKRFQIICGIGRGLLYLHQDSRLRIIHRDLKASNILLDNEMNPKISDFGLARIFGGDEAEEKTNRVIGTLGYIAPEYAFGGLFSIKSDVFSFGILVLEIVNGNKSSGFHHENSGITLVGHAWKLLKEGNALELLDTYLRGTSHYNPKEVLRCVHVGLLCVQQDPVDRPDMSSAVLMLGSEVELPQPEPPGFFMKMGLATGDRLPTLPESSSTNEMTISMLEAR